MLNQNNLKYIRVKSFEVGKLYYHAHSIALCLKKESSYIEIYELKSNRVYKDFFTNISQLVPHYRLVDGQ